MEPKPSSAAAEDRCNPVKVGPASIEDVMLALCESKEDCDSHLRSLFNLFDSDNIGYLDYSHIESGLSALHQIPPEYKYANDLLRFCDSNHDDYPEFRRYVDAKDLKLYTIFQQINVVVAEFQESPSEDRVGSGVMETIRVNFPEALKIKTNGSRIFVPHNQQQ